MNILKRDFTVMSDAPWEEAPFGSLVTYWRELSDKSGGLPERRHLDPLRLRDNLSNIHIATILEDDIPFELVGTKVQSSVHSGLRTGTGIRHLLGDEQTDKLVRALSQAYDNEQGLYGEGERIYQYDRVIRFDFIFLPLKGREEGQRNLMQLSRTLDDDSRLVDRTYLSLRHGPYQFFN